LTGFPVLISRVVYTNAHLLHVGDAILSINHEDISTFTHDQVITKLRNTSGDQLNLTVKYMNNMAPYLHSTSTTTRSSFSSVIPSTVQTSFTLPTSSSVRMRRQQNRMSAEYPSRYHRPGKQQQRLSLMLSDHQQVRILQISSVLHNRSIDRRKEFTQIIVYTYFCIDSYSKLANRDMQNTTVYYK
jgi:hypothetical protein